MLRLLQTNALSDKVIKLFETLTPKSNFQAQPLLVEVKRLSNDRLISSTARISAARNRRMRRTRLAGASGTFRSSWY